jgi:transcriptional regulator with XRE-family HTH domain
MARSTLNREFLAEIAHQLREGLLRRDQLARREGKRYTRVDAANDLEVSRASLQFYLAGTHMPSSDVLRRAMELWGIELTYRDRKLTVLDLQSTIKVDTPTSIQPVQLLLWDSIKGLENDALTVKVERKGPQSITLQVEIGFRAGLRLASGD